MRLPLTGLEIPSLGNNYWSHPPSAEYGDPSAEVLYQHVGMALSTWESVDASFAWLFSMLMHPSPAAERVYGTIEKTAGKVDAINAAAAYVFGAKGVDEDIRETWKELAKHYAAAAPRRNDIAHAYVVQYNLRDENRGWFLVPAHHVTKKTALPWDAFKKADIADLSVFGMSYRLTSGDISSVIRKFGELSGWAMLLTSEYAQRHGPR